MVLLQFYATLKSGAGVDVAKSDGREASAARNLHLKDVLMSDRAYPTRQSMLENDASLPHGGNTPHGGNGHVTHRRPTHNLGIGLLRYLRSILLHR